MDGDAGRANELPQPGDRDELADVLRSAFPESSSATQRTLLATAEIRSFRSKQSVVAQGEESRVGLVLEGFIGYRRTTVDGREVIPRIGSRGYLGPFMPIAGRPTTAECVALSPSRVALWSGNAVSALAAGDAGFAFDLLQHVLFAFEEVVERMDGLLYQNALRRVARVLDQHADLLFSEEGGVTRAYLPALVGTSREMTGRVLRQLESDGLVERIGRNRLRLLDASGLASTAGGSAVGPRPRRSEQVPRRAAARDARVMSSHRDAG
jgi:CRP/FNR family transcriptional regulator, cyclic AMP receptor protein